MRAVAMTSSPHTNSTGAPHGGASAPRLSWGSPPNSFTHLNGTDSGVSLHAARASGRRAQPGREVGLGTLGDLLALLMDEEVRQKLEA